MAHMYELHMEHVLSIVAACNAGPARDQPGHGGRGWTDRGGAVRPQLEWGASQIQAPRWPGVLPLPGPRQGRERGILTENSSISALLHFLLEQLFLAGPLKLSHLILVGLVALPGPCQGGLAGNEVGRCSVMEYMCAHWGL